MGGAIALVGFLVFALGVITLIKPIGEIKIPTRGRAAQVLVAGVVIFLVGAFVAGSDKKDSAEASGSSSAPAKAVASTAPKAPVLPSDETNFIDAITSARSAYRAAQNDMAKGGIRASRRTAICQALAQMSVRNWVGRIQNLSSNSEGKGVLEISIAKDVSVKTWNNALSDIADKTLIATDSALFQTASRMKVGDTVYFSGSFLRSSDDCVRESSLTTDGSMKDPAFIIQFDSIQKF